MCLKTLLYIFSSVNYFKNRTRGFQDIGGKTKMLWTDTRADNVKTVYTQQSLQGYNYNNDINVNCLETKKR